MSRLQIYRGDELLAEHVLMRAVVGLGRHPENDIVLDDRTLSRFHARVERRGDQYVVVDLGAQNGVQVNGARIVGESGLAAGDRIGLGRYVAVFTGGYDPMIDEEGGGHSGTLAEELDVDLGLDVDDEDDVARGLDASDEVLEAPAPAHDNGRTVAKPSESRTATSKPSAKNRDKKDKSDKAKKKRQPTLVVLFNSMEVSRHTIDKELVVGRSKNCDVVISLLGLSRRHARVMQSGDGFTVEDMGSQNGTWVNNQRVEGTRRLRHGDLLNFYDYGVLFLEDGDVDIGFMGAGFAAAGDDGPRTVNQDGAKPSAANGHADDLSQRETNRAIPAAADSDLSSLSQSQAAVRRPQTGKSPVPIADSEASRPPPSAAAADLLDDLGEGSFLAEDFEASRNEPASSVLDEDPAFDAPPPAARSKASGKRKAAPVPKDGTDLIENFDFDDALKDDSDEGGVQPSLDEDLEADVAFREAQRFEQGNPTFEHQRDVDPTSFGAGSVVERGGWPDEAALSRAMNNADDNALVTLEITLDGKPYTQMALSNAVTRIGTDPRCELSLPKSSGLSAWHMTVVQVGATVVCYRAHKRASLKLAGVEVDKALLSEADALELGKVTMKLRIR